MTSTHIRTAVPDDALAVASLHARSWQAAYRRIVSDEYLDRLRPEDRIERYTFDRGDPTTLVACQPGEILGFVTFGPSRDADVREAAEVYALYVDPAHWRRGIGRCLIAKARVRLAARRFSEAILWALAENQSARHFYCKDGWLPDGLTRRRGVGGADVEETRYRRHLE